MDLRPTTHQLHVIEHREGPLVVRAGAGAGKTRVLVERLIGLLRDRCCTLDELVVITFTRKAAGELAARIDAALDIEIERAAEAGSGEQEYWIHQKRKLSRAAITTIHGFCGRLLRQYPLEAEVAPAFQVADETESHFLLRTALEGLFSERLESGDARLDLLCSLYNRDRVQEAILNCYAKMRAWGIAPDDLEVSRNGTARAPADMWEGLLDRAQQLLDTVESLEERDDLSASLRKRLQKARAAWPAFRTRLAELRRLTGFPVQVEQFEEAADWLGLLQEIVSGAYLGGNVQESVRPLLKKLKELLADELPARFISLFEPAFQDFARELLAGLDESYTAGKRARGLLDYEDLQIGACRLLHRHPRVREECLKRYRYLMIDEYQDTNGLQQELLQLLTCLPHEQGACNLVIVGDPKQSIYRFRGAEVEVFQRTALDLAARGGGEVNLLENFRSSPVLIDFQNWIFGCLLRDGQAGSGIEFQPAVAGARSRSGASGDTGGDAGTPGGTAVLPAGVDWLLTHYKGSNFPSRKAEAERLADYLRGCIEQEGWSYQDVALLFRSMSDVKEYELALRRRGLPCTVLSGQGLYDRQEIQDMLNVLLYLENRGNRIALAGILRSPMFLLHDGSLFELTRRGDLAAAFHDPSTTLSDPEQHALLLRARRLLALLREKRKTETLSGMIESIIELTGFDTALACQSDGLRCLANLERLLELSHSFERRETRGSRSFLRYVRWMRKYEGRESEAALSGENSIVLMSIHRAKGLEWPVVVLPDLAREPRREALPVALSRGTGLQISLRLPGRGNIRGQRADSEAMARYRSLETVEEHLESRRLFYVAVTRARNRLVFSSAVREFRLSDTVEDLHRWVDWLAHATGVNDLEQIPETCPVPGEHGAELRVDYHCFEDTAEFDTWAAGERTIPQLTVPETGWSADLAGRLWQESEPPSGLGAAPEIKTVSANALNDLVHCERLYLLRHRLGLPASKDTGIGGGNGDHSPLSAARLGEWAHQLIACRTAEEREIRGRQLLRGQGISDEPECRKILRHIGELLDHFEQHELARRARDSQFRRDEQPFLLRLGPRWAVHGRMDRLCLEQDRWLIIDFKTHRIPAEAVPVVAERYRLQLMLYAAAVGRAAREKQTVLPIEAYLYFLHPGCAWQLPAADLTSESLASCLETMHDALDRLHRGNLTEQMRLRSTGSKCAGCPYPEWCQRDYALPGGCQEDPAAAG